MIRKLSIFLSLPLIFAAVQFDLQAKSNSGGTKMAFQIKSPAFSDNGMMPSIHTCDDKDISPQLQWTEPPQGTKSFALINDDPDAPMGTWVHWVIFNLPAGTRQLEQNFPKDKELKNGAKQGINDFGKIGYGGPCPPSGTHRYFFKLYALDALLNLPAGATKNQLLDAMKGHTLAETQIIGKYKRK